MHRTSICKDDVKFDLDAALRHARPLPQPFRIYIVLAKIYSTLNGDNEMLQRKQHVSLQPGDRKIHHSTFFSNTMGPLQASITTKSSILATPHPHPSENRISHSEPVPNLLSNGNTRTEPAAALVYRTVRPRKKGKRPHYSSIVNHAPKERRLRA